MIQNYRELQGASKLYSSDCYHFTNNISNEFINEQIECYVGRCKIGNLLTRVQEYQYNGFVFKNWLFLFTYLHTVGTYFKSFKQWKFWTVFIL